MQQLNNKNILLEMLAQGATLITPNNRLSASLLVDYYKHLDQKTIDKPQCLPYTNFLSHAYQRLKFTQPQQNHPILLNHAQYQHLWMNIIKEDTQITYSEGLLQAVMQAWEHSEQWLINNELDDFNYTPQTRQFQLWWQQFNQHLRKINALCEPQILPYLLTTDVKIISADKLIWVCFDDYNPQQLMLQNYLTELDVEQFNYDLAPQAFQPELLAAADTTEEYQQLISWLHSKLARNETRIAVVVPNLEQKARAIQRLLVQHFEPNLFNISLGEKLSEFPLVAHALNWLKLDLAKITQHQAALLLQSPYLNYAKEELSQRAEYLQNSALLQNPSFAFKTFTTDLSLFGLKLSSLLQQLAHYPEQTSVEHWIKLFQERLNAIGFPGDNELNSKNYQYFNRFALVFDEFRQLHILNNTLTREEGLNAFERLCNNTIFQPQTVQTPIQILGLLEASGCEYQSVWVLGLNDQCLPQKCRLSAFIPQDLQRRLHMPHSLPERELQFAQQILNRLHWGSSSFICSYPKLEGDSPNLPCALIANYQHYNKIAQHAPSNSCHLEPLSETYNIPLDLQKPLSGGTALLANQAKCPFKAFATHRLAANAAQDTYEGLDPKAKGQIIHKIMELIWRHLQNQQALLTIDSDSLNTLIDKSIQTALTPFLELQTAPLIVREIEHTRLKRLVMANLEWEKQRPDFSIAALEQSYELHLAGLNFKLRIDRLDDVGDHKWVIDYKTSLPAAKPWNEERPSEPQLLMYALLDSTINALLLVQLKTGQMQCAGFSEEKQDLRGISNIKKDESWQTNTARWQQQLTLLSEEFQQGHCPPIPLNAAVCQLCDFQNLCRFQVNE